MPSRVRGPQTAVRAVGPRLGKATTWQAVGPGVTALHPLLAARWSPRSFDATHVLTDDDVGALLEAARWAPSASNSQPWRFAVAHRGMPEHAAVVDALVGWNQQWAPAASALLVAAAVTVTDEGKPLRWAAYDTGQAVAHLSLQAQAMGLAVHQMGGFDTEVVTRLLGTDPAGAPQALVPQTVVAVGRHDPTAVLPEKLAARETAPRERLDPATLLRPVRSQWAQTVVAIPPSTGMTAPVT